MTRDSVQESYLAAVSGVLSPARLRLGFRAALAEPGARVLARHLWNMALCEALYPTLHVLELSLRNRLDEVIGSSVPPCTIASGTPAELPAAGSWLDAESGVLAARAREEIRRLKARLFAHEKKTVTHDRLVAGLPLGFWTGLLTRIYEIGPQSSYDPTDGKPTALWPRHLRAAFPHLARSLRTRSHVYAVLSDLARLRNQVFHHRPVWRLDLNSLHASASQAIGWISPELRDTVVHVDRFPSIYAEREDFYLRLVERIIDERWSAR